jgi:hypothetical protein
MSDDEFATICEAPASAGLPPKTAMALGASARSS